MDDAGAVIAALAIDAAVGWPAALYARIGHPVGAFARALSGCERRWNRATGSDAWRRAMGIVTLLLVGGGAALIGWAVQAVILALGGPWASAGIALAAWPALAQRSLIGHYRAVRAPLNAGDMDAARRAVGMIVGRDTAPLDEAGIASAAIESLAESFCDGIVAPVFWFVLLGLPGLWAFKAVSTADSLIGHPEPPLRAFGWAAARIDDVMNLAPARLSGALICLAGGGGWRILWRDHGRHASPNAGWPEAAMAGAVGIRLAGPIRYDGAWVDKPWIGDGSRADIAAMNRADKIFLRACAGLWMVAGVCAWAL